MRDAVECISVQQPRLLHRVTQRVLLVGQVGMRWFVGLLSQPDLRFVVAAVNDVVAIATSVLHITDRAGIARAFTLPCEG
jgi:hypothetical protein